MAHSHQNTLLSRLGFSDPDRSDPKHTLACEYLCKPDVALKVLAVVGCSTVVPPKPEDVITKEDRPPSIGSWVSMTGARTEHPIMNGNYYIGFADVVIGFSQITWRAERKETVWESIPRESKHECRRGLCALCQSGNKAWGANHTVTKRDRWGMDVPDREPCGAWCQYCSRGVPLGTGSDEQNHIEKYTDRVEVGTKYQYEKDGNPVSLLIEVKVKRCDPADIVKQIKLYRQYRGNKEDVVATCYPVSQSTKDMLKREGIHHIFLGAGFEAYCAERRAEKPVSEEGL